MKPEKEWLREVGSRVIVITTWPQEGQMGLKRAKPGRKRERRDLVQEGTSLIFGPPEKSCASSARGLAASFCANA